MGTVILARNEFPLMNIATIPSGRTSATDCSGIRLINVNDPSDSTRRAEIKRFFNPELPPIFYAASHSRLIGWDFKCILQPADTTDPFSTNRDLSKICGA